MASPGDPGRPLVISVTEIEDPEGAGARYAEANEEFVAWYKSQIRQLSGIDPNTTPLGPPTTQKFFWQGE